MKKLSTIILLLIISGMSSLFAQIVVSQGINRTNIDLSNSTVVGQVTLNAPVSGKVIVQFDGECIADVGDRIVLAASNTTSWGVNDGNVGMEAVNSDVNRKSFSHTRVYNVSAGNKTFYAIAHNYVETDGSGIASIYGSLTAEFIPNGPTLVGFQGISRTNINLNSSTVVGQVTINPSTSGKVIVRFDGQCYSDVGDRIVLAASNTTSWGVNDGNVGVEAANADVNINPFSHTRVYNVSAGSKTFYAIAHNYVETDGSGIASIYGSLTAEFIPDGPPVGFQGISRTNINLTNSTIVGQVTINPPAPGLVVVHFDGQCFSDPGDRIVLAASNNTSWSPNDGNVSVEAVNSDVNINSFSHTRVYDVSAGSKTFYAIAHNYVETDGSGIASVYGSLTAKFISTTVFDVSPNSRSVGTGAGNTTFSVNSSVGWSVEDDASWLTATKTDGSTISVSYQENTLSSSRTAHIRAYGTGGVEETVTVTQEGQIIFDVSPNSRSVGPAAGNTSFSVNSNVGWNVEDDASWLTATKTDGSTISVSFEANISNSSRTAHIRAYGTGGIEETVTVTQQGEAAYIDVSPDYLNVASGSGSATFSVNANVGWSVEDDASWLTATKTDGSTISVSYDANTSTDSRTAHIRAYGGGVEETVTVIQEGESVYLEVSPNSRSVGPGAGNTTFSVNSSVGWSVEDDASWLTATKTDGSTISVSYSENTSYSNRAASIRVYCSGGMEETVMVEQDGAQVDAIATLEGNAQILIQPNPASDIMYLRSASDINSEVSISLIDISGKVVYKHKLDRVLSGEIIEIDISTLNKGVYLLRMDKSESSEIIKVIKQ